jgi:DNA-binding Lrp family transcriptional regulator
MHRLKNYTDTILDILQDEKNHISPKICAMAQEVKNLLQEYPWNAETFLRAWRKDGNAPLMESALGPLKEKVAECHRRIDDLYDLIREEVQRRMEDLAENVAAEKHASSPAIL